MSDPRAGSSGASSNRCTHGVRCHHHHHHCGRAHLSVLLPSCLQRLPPEEQAPRLAAAADASRDRQQPTHAGRTPHQRQLRHPASALPSPRRPTAVLRELSPGCTSNLGPQAFASVRRPNRKACCHACTQQLARPEPCAQALAGGSQASPSSARVGLAAAPPARLSAATSQPNSMRSWAHSLAAAGSAPAAAAPVRCVAAGAAPAAPAGSSKSVAIIGGGMAGARLSTGPWWARIARWPARVAGGPPRPVLPAPAIAAGLMCATKLRQLGVSAPLRQ